MSLRSHVQEIAREAAQVASKEVANLRLKEILAQTSGMGKVKRTNGTSLVVRMADGAEKTVTNVGGRYVGKDSAVVTDGGGNPTVAI